MEKIRNYHTHTLFCGHGKGYPIDYAKIALENNIDVFQPIKIKEDNEWLVTKKPDLIITCAYGQIVPQKVLDIPALKCINVHGSLLPKLRGAAPIQYAIL